MTVDSMSAHHVDLRLKRLAFGGVRRVEHVYGWVSFWTARKPRG